MIYKEYDVSSKKRIALVAHDNKKEELVQCGISRLPVTRALRITYSRQTCLDNLITDRFRIMTVICSKERFDFMRSKKAQRP